MTRRTKIWLGIASVFTLVNLGGFIVAAAGGEGGHALVHLALLVPGVYWVWRLVSPRGARGDAQLVDQKLAQLQQSMDAIALQVERVGEAQRFAAKVVAERGKAAGKEG